jgi:hypothetical protein
MRGKQGCSGDTRSDGGRAELHEALESRGKEDTIDGKEGRECVLPSIIRTRRSKVRVC